MRAPVGLSRSPPWLRLLWCLVGILLLWIGMSVGVYLLFFCFLVWCARAGR